MSIEPNHHDSMDGGVTFTVTTENEVGRAGIKRVRRIVIGGSAFFLAISIGGLFMSFNGPDTVVWSGCAIVYFIMSVVCFCTSFPRRGVWRITDTVIEHLSLNGKMTHTTWNQIQAVKWSRYCPAFRSAAGKILLPLQFTEELKRDAILAFIESQLGEFDLQHRRKRIKRTWKRWATVALIAVLSVAIWFIGINIPAVQIKLSFIKDPEKFSRIMWFTAAIFTFMFLMQLIDGRLPKWRQRGVRYPGFEENQ